MLVSVVTLSVYIIAAYCATGIVVALCLHGRGLAKVDPGTRGASVLFRLLITPGLVALWPVFALKWRRAVCGSLNMEPAAPVPLHRLRVLHGAAIQLLAVMTPIMAGAAIYYRPPVPIRAALPAGAVTTSLPGEFHAVAVNTIVDSDTSVELMSDGAQLFLCVKSRRDWTIGLAGLYWSPTADEEETPARPIFLGTYSGEDRRYYRIPTTSPGGILHVYSFREADFVDKVRLASRADE